MSDDTTEALRCECCGVQGQGLACRTCFVNNCDNETRGKLCTAARSASSVSAAASSSTGEADTRAAVSEAIYDVANAETVQLYMWEAETAADAAVAAFLAHPPQWLKDLTRSAHGEWCSGITEIPYCDETGCASVPASVRSAAGLEDTPKESNDD